MGKLTRKEFLKGSSAAAIGLGVLGGSFVDAFAAATEDIPFEKTVDWAAEYDVIVIGHGMAGLASARVAAEAGARVLLVEKCSYDEAGGNSRFSAQAFITCEAGEQEQMLSYLKGVRGNYDTPEDDILETFVQVCSTNVEWVNTRGGNWQFRAKAGAYTQYEGYESIVAYTQNGASYDAGSYLLFRSFVQEMENIDVWYNAPARSLIQDGNTRIVHGVCVETEGQLYNVRAMDGVIICTGGFENNYLMGQFFLQLPHIYPKGSLSNTGDGIFLASAAGAELWHMSNATGPDLDVVNFDSGRSYGSGLGLRLRGYSRSERESTRFSTRSTIFVGADGTRFTNEAIAPDHGFIDFHGRKIMNPVSLPAYAVFDSKAFREVIYHEWDNKEMLEKGVIKSADSLEDLSLLLGLPEGSLSATVSEYNTFCTNGYDPEFKRGSDYLIAFEKEGPYYAIELQTTILNTQGGPRRNAKGEIVDKDRNPIPHLYGAGECGSIWGDMYPGGGNLAECLTFGRISGENAAAKKTDNLRESVLDDAVPVNFAYTGEAIEAEAENERIGVGNGIGGDLVLRVTLEDGKMLAIDILEQHETPGIGSKAIAELPTKILAAQSTEVDDIATATITSRAIKEAVNNALS